MSQKTFDAVSSWNVPNSVLLLLCLKHPVLRAVDNPRCSPRLFRACSPQCLRSVLVPDWIVVLPSALRCGEIQGRCRVGVGITFILLILWFCREYVCPGAVRSVRCWSDNCGAHCSFSYSWPNTAIGDVAGGLASLESTVQVGLCGYVKCWTLKADNDTVVVYPVLLAVRKSRWFVRRFPGFVCVSFR